MREGSKEVKRQDEERAGDEGKSGWEISLWVGSLLDGGSLSELLHGFWS
jgi:hypothetical protein